MHRSDCTTIGHEQDPAKRTPICRYFPGAGGLSGYADSYAVVLTVELSQIWLPATGYRLPATGTTPPF